MSQRSSRQSSLQKENTSTRSPKLSKLSHLPSSAFDDERVSGDEDPSAAFSPLPTLMRKKSQGNFPDKIMHLLEYKKKSLRMVHQLSGNNRNELSYEKLIK